MGLQSLKIQIALVIKKKCIHQKEILINADGGEERVKEEEKKWKFMDFHSIL